MALYKKNFKYNKKYHLTYIDFHTKIIKMDYYGLTNNHYSNSHNRRYSNELFFYKQTK